LSGGFVSIHPILNWRTTERGLEPGPLGVEAESPVVHVRGERVTASWLEESKAMLRDTTKAPDPERIAALAAVLLRASRDPLRYNEAERKALEGMPELLADAAKRLWPEARAWLVFATPKGELREQRVRRAQRVRCLERALVVSHRRKFVKSLDSKQFLQPQRLRRSTLFFRPMRIPWFVWRGSRCA
jgi:hypothetical protein